MSPPAAARVLLADPNGETRDYLARVLGDRWAVDAVGDGADALAAARGAPPGLVLAAVGLPSLDGLALLRALRADDATREVPVILMSGADDEVSAEDALADGADDHLVRPFSAREVVARVRASLALAAARRTSAAQERAHARRLQRLAEAATAINATLSVRETLQTAAEQACAVVEARFAVATLGDDAGPEPVRVEAGDVPSDEPLGSGARLDARFGGRDGAASGTIALHAHAGRGFTEQDAAALAQLAEMATAALRNARLFEEARRASQHREELLAVVSHDLRNPLSVVVMGAANLARLAPPDARGERLRRQAESIQRAAERMTRMINDLLDSAAIEARRLAVELGRHDVAALLAEVREHFQPLATHKGVRLDVAPAGEGAWVSCDRERLLQVFSNLIGNAVKFSPAGATVTVRAAVEPGRVRFSVGDAGPGVPPDQLPRIFERYWRGQGGTRGAGLGLFIARGILDAHGGRIWVESRVGEGSTFYFTVPRATESQPAT